LFAELVRKYKRFPTDRELQIFRRGNPELPAENTFRRQFGTKTDLKNAIRVWSLANDEFLDVAMFLPEMPTQPESKLIPVKQGWVYLLKPGNYYKIGCGEELERRVKQIKTALPDAASLEHAIRTDDPFGIENYWHRRFEEKRTSKNNEWFRLDPADVAAFKKRKFQ
jgi:hypothetical protein